MFCPLCFSLFDCYRPYTLLILQLTNNGYDSVVVYAEILLSASFVESYSAVELSAANATEWENVLDMQLKVWFFYIWNMTSLRHERNATASIFYKSDNVCSCHRISWCGNIFVASVHSATTGSQ